MSIAIYASGSQTAVISTEHFLSSPNVAGDFALTLDLNNMAANDVLEVRAYKMAIAGGTQRLLWFHAFYGVQPDYAKNALSEWITNALTDTNALRFSIKQTFGTGRVFDWSVTRRHDSDLATAAKLLKYVQLLARKDAAIATDNATELTEINANGGSGAGAYVSTTDSQEAIRDNAGSGGATAAQVWDYLTADADTASSMGALVVSKLGSLSTPVSYATPINPLTRMLTIIRGDDYHASDSRAVEYPVTGYPSFTGGTVVFKFGKVTEGTEFTVTGSSSAVGDVQTLSANLTSAQTTALKLGSGTYIWEFQITLASGRIVTPIGGGVNVIQDVG